MDTPRAHFLVVFCGSMRVGCDREGLTTNLTQRDLLGNLARFEKCVSFVLEGKSKLFLIHPGGNITVVVY